MRKKLAIRLRAGRISRASDKIRRERNPVAHADMAGKQTAGNNSQRQ
jgi:hypothetical protein